jgi:Ca-activated chloride channel family protein
MRILSVVCLVLVLANCTSYGSQENTDTGSTSSQAREELVVTGLRASDNRRSSSRKMLGVLAQEPSALPPQEKYRDDFEEFDANPVYLVSESPISTFSSDVDTASYSFIRKRLNAGFLPEKSAVRLEEMVNYFDYQYPTPSSEEEPFKATVTVHDSPWASDRKLIHIGIQGYEIEKNEQPDSNLVFLLDVSGSMSAPDKLPLVKKSMNLLLSQLKPSDTVAIVVYAGAAGTVLEPTQAKNKTKINAALKKLEAGGSTAGGQGLKLAYSLAEQNFKEGAVNRIILATDGDFNVGISNREELKSYVERKREKGIYLSILGFGQGNYRDHMMQSLAQNGNGIAAYIDTLSEAQKILVNEATSSLFPIAKDLKLQVEFNPNSVREYRLLGYETRALKREDFNNDKVDAGDIGSGHSVTAIYEITLVNSTNPFIEKKRYLQDRATDLNSLNDELAYLKIRYKRPNKDESELMQQAIKLNGETRPKQAFMQEVKFATAVAGFAQLLKDGKYIQNWGLEDIIATALENRGEDDYGYRSEFVQLVRKAKLAAKAEM